MLKYVFICKNMNFRGLPITESIKVDYIVILINNPPQILTGKNE